jgi:hypothetical protein
MKAVYFQPEASSAVTINELAANPLRRNYLTYRIAISLLLRGLYD